MKNYKVHRKTLGDLPIVRAGVWSKLKQEAISLLRDCAEDEVVYVTFPSAYDRNLAASTLRSTLKRLKIKAKIRVGVNNDDPYIALFWDDD